MRSSDTRGLFVSIDGPSGAGKSTLIDHLRHQLIAGGHDVHFTGPGLACLYAADRYHHLTEEIRPNLAAGKIVVTDRYTPSALVMQRFDGVHPDFLWDINAAADRPDHVVILQADPAVIARRLKARGTRNRLQEQECSSQKEAAFYAEAAIRLLSAGFNVIRVDCTMQGPEHLANLIVERIGLRPRLRRRTSHRRSR